MKNHMLRMVFLGSLVGGAVSCEEDHKSGNTVIIPPATLITRETLDLSPKAMSVTFTPALSSDEILCAQIFVMVPKGCSLKLAAALQDVNGTVFAIAEKLADESAQPRTILLTLKPTSNTVMPGLSNLASLGYPQGPSYKIVLTVTDFSDVVVSPSAVRVSVLVAHAVAMNWPSSLLQ